MAQLESNYQRTQSPNSFLSWRSILCGLLITMLSFAVLMALGIAVGGIAMSDLEGFRALGWGAALWTIVAAMVGLGVGTFYSSRVSNYFSSPIGMVQGATVSALFFFFVFWGSGAFLGSLGGAITGATQAMIPQGGNVAQVAQQVASNPQVRGVINEQLAQLGVEPEEADSIASELITRLLFDGQESARNFLVSETNVDPAQVEAQLSQIENRVTEYARGAVQQAARGFSAAGWFIFAILILGSGSAMYGGVLGARRNKQHPLVESDSHTSYAA